jgi:ribosome recycling factor
MAYNFAVLIKKIAETEEWFKNELTSVRTGRATPTLLDSVKVDAYGSKMPINQVANIGVEDPRVLRVVPFDAGLAKDVEKGIAAADLGVGIMSDGKTIRVSFPVLTTERREQLMRLAKQKMEDARISLRKARDEAWSEIQAQEKEGLLTEDDKFIGKEKMQEHIDAGNKKLEELLEKKEEEIMN